MRYNNMKNQFIGALLTPGLPVHEFAGNAQHTDTGGKIDGGDTLPASVIRQKNCYNNCTTAYKQNCAMRCNCI